MSTTQSSELEEFKKHFEAWAIDADYSVHKNKLGLYTMQRTKRAWVAYQAATRRQEAKIKVLTDALEKLACLGNGDGHGNSVGNCIAIDALAKAKETT